MTRHGTDDMVHFSLAPPLVADESGPYGLEKWFDSWKTDIGYEIRDLEIVAGDGVAFSHSLNHLSGVRRAAKSRTSGSAITLGFRKVEGEWKIVHAHESVPFTMDGSSKASIDLKP